MEWLKDVYGPLAGAIFLALCVAFRYLPPSVQARIRQFGGGR